MTEQTIASPIREKWGDALNGGFLVVPSALLRHQRELNLDSGEALLVMNLIMSWWKTDEYPFPHTATLAKRMGVSRRTVQRHVESLERKGMIRRIWKSSGKQGRRAAASYDLAGLVAHLKRLGSVAHPARKSGSNLQSTQDLDDPA